MQPEDGGPTDSNPVRTIRDEKNGSPKMEGMSEHSNTVRNTSPAHSHRSQASVHSHAGQSRHHPRRGHQHINTKHERDLLTKILTNQELQRPYSVYEADELVQNILRLQRASQRFDNAPSSQHEISGSESMRSIGGTSSPYDNATASQNASDIETGSPVESNRNPRKSHRFQYWRNPPAFQELTTRQKICSVIRCPANSALGFWYNLYIAFLVIASMILLVIQSCLLNDPTNVDYFTNYWSNPIFWINAFISINFLLEIIVEFIATSNRKEYIFSWFFLMQILSILPFLLELIALLANVDPAAIEALRVLAILRLIRLFRLIVIFQSINVDSSIFVRAVRSSTFALLFLGFFLTAGLLFFSALIFYVETAYCFLDPTGTWIYSDLQVSICNPGLIIHTCDAVTSGYPCVFQNIPDAMWWFMQTVTTVGYGDSVPITLGGKLVAALCMIVSLIIIPLPIAIFNANLTELYFEERSKRRAMRRAFEYMQKDESGVDWDVPSEVMTADVKSIGVLNSDDVGVVKEDENDVFASVGFSPSSQRSINQHSVTTVSNSSQLRHLLDLLSTYHGEFAKETESLSHSLTELREKQMMVQHWLIEAQKLNNPTNVGAISRKASKVFNQH